MPAKRRYLNFTTHTGVSLEHAAKSGGTAFLIHDCGYLADLEHWDHPGVDSPFWRFYHNQRPGCHLLFQGQKIPLEPKTCVLIPANTIFDCCGPVPTSHLWLHFTVTRPGAAIPEIPMILTLDATLRALLGDLMESHRATASEARDLKIYHQSAALLHAAFARVDLPVAPAIPERLLAVLEIIHRAPQADLSNPVLSVHAGMSVERFIRTFRQHLGLTPAAHVMATRVRLAGEALALTDKTIDEIAIEKGFPNRHYFTRVFTREMGCGPAEFRARQQQRRGI